MARQGRKLVWSQNDRKWAPGLGRYVKKVKRAQDIKNSIQNGPYVRRRMEGTAQVIELGRRKVDRFERCVAF